MEALLKNLKEHVTCSICLDTYTDPKTIDCLHTFCLECLKKHTLTSQKQGFYRCPECQANVGVVSPINVIKTINVITTINVIKINHKCNTNHKCNNF